MNDQSILVTMLQDIQGRLGRIETSQSDVVARVVKIEEHCTTCAPKSTAGPAAWWKDSYVIPIAKYALMALVGAYLMGKSSNNEAQVTNITKALSKARIQVDSAVPTK